jgi:hypothetical protein
VNRPVISFQFLSTSIIFLIIEKLFEFVYRKVPWWVGACISFKSLVILFVVKLLHVYINLLYFDELVWEVGIGEDFLLITVDLVMVRMWDLVDEPSVDVVITAIVHLYLIYLKYLNY